MSGDYSDARAAAGHAAPPRRELHASPDQVARVLAPACIITPDTVYTGMSLALDAQGRVLGLEPTTRAAARRVPVETLPRRALLPGFVNAHSHVFQRLLRGRTHGGAGPASSFWSWRDLMYRAAADLTPDSLYAIARRCYGEMLGAGYTAAGEFHYVHHSPSGAPYEDPLAMARALLAAAADAGIRLVLLPVAYTRDGIGRPPEPLQRRFCFATVDQYLRFVDDLASIVRDPRHGIGVAPHSVRAVPTAWLPDISAYARRHGLVTHVHVSEQMAEVEEIQSRFGCTPIALLAAHGVLGAATTLVHATHAAAGDVLAIAGTSTRVCVCPTTEGDLGDGIAPYALFAAHSVSLAVGSDGQTRIDPFEELRWAEFSARMRYQRRRVLTPGDHSPAVTLLTAGSAGGARSLGLATGNLEPGEWADLVAVDLDHPSLHGSGPDDLRDVLVFGASAAVVTDVWVAGSRVAGEGSAPGTALT